MRENDTKQLTIESAQRFDWFVKRFCPFVTKAINIGLTLPVTIRNIECSLRKLTRVNTWNRRVSMSEGAAVWIIPATSIRRNRPEENIKLVDNEIEKVKWKIRVTFKLLFKKYLFFMLILI